MIETSTRFENFVAMLHLACVRILLRHLGRLPRTLIMPTLNVGKESRFTTIFFATTVIASFAYFAIALLLMHALRPERALATTFISGYAVGPYGWVMTTAWLAASSGCVMLVLGPARTGPRSAAARLGTLLLAVLSIGLLITAIFPPGPNRSGEIHSMTFFVNVFCILLASVLLSVGFGSDVRWRAFRLSAAMLASLLVFAFALQFLTAYIEVLPGLANRFFATVFVAWLLAISIKLRALARE
jgi:uncharacterized protein DUF998